MCLTEGGKGFFVFLFLLRVLRGTVRQWTSFPRTVTVTNDEVKTVLRAAATTTEKMRHYSLRTRYARRYAWLRRLEPTGMLISDTWAHASHRADFNRGKDRSARDCCREYMTARK
jgi:hypothetical protein